MIKNQKGSIIIISLVVIVLVAIGATGYFVYTSKTSDSKGSSMSSNKAAKCDTDKCFQAKFIKCEPASLQQVAAFNGGAKAYYEIVGGDTANCKMLYRDDSDNLEMICTYQDTSIYNTGQDDEFVLAASKKEFKVTSGEDTTCTGPKVEKLKQVKSKAS